GTPSTARAMDLLARKTDVKRRTLPFFPESPQEETGRNAGEPAKEEAEAGSRGWLWDLPKSPGRKHWSAAHVLGAPPGLDRWRGPVSCFMGGGSGQPRSARRLRQRCPRRPRPGLLVSPPRCRPVPPAR